MSRMIPVLFSAAVLTCASGLNPGLTAQTRGTTPAPGTGRGAPAAAKVDVKFLSEQLAMSTKEVGLAELAAKRATRPDVKRFATMLLREHQQTAAELRKIAARHKVTAAAPADQLKVERDRLSKLSGDQFEREYLDEIIADHQDAVRDLEAVVKDENAEIRRWTEKTLPIVRRHLDEARKLRAAAPQKGVGAA